MLMYDCYLGEQLAMQREREIRERAKKAWMFEPVRDKEPRGRLGRWPMRLSIKDIGWGIRLPLIGKMRLWS